MYLEQSGTAVTPHLLARFDRQRAWRLQRRGTQ
jgi:hypothetical protein